jgi:hypothetical protein
MTRAEPIPQRVVVRRVSLDLDADYDSGLWMGLRHSYRDLFDWLFDKEIPCVAEKIPMPASHEQLMVVTALFDKHTDLMECLMKFDIPNEKERP